MCYNGCRREEEGSLRHDLFRNHSGSFTLDFFLKKYIDKKYARKVKKSTSRWKNLHREVLQQRCNVKSSRKTPESHDCDTQCHYGFLWQSFIILQCG